MANPADFSQRESFEGGGGGGSLALTAAPPLAPPTQVALRRIGRQRPEILSARPSPGLLLDSYRRRFWLATILGLFTAAAVSAALWFVIPAKYEAYAQMKIDQQTKIVAFDIVARGTDFETYKRTQQTLMKSRPVLETALQDFGAGKLALLRGVVDQVQWLNNQLSVEFPYNSEVMRISLKAEQPPDLAPMVNAVFDAYFKVVVTQEVTERRKRREDLEKRYQNYVEDIRSKSSEIHQLAMGLGTSDIPAARLKQSLAIRTLDQLGQNRDELQRQLSANELEGELAEKKISGVNNSVSEESLGYEIDRDPRVVELLQTQRKMEQELSDIEAKVRHSKTDPGSIRKSQEIQSVQKKLDEARKTAREDLIRRIKAGGAAADGHSGRSLEELAIINNRLKERIAKVLKEYEEQYGLVQTMEKYSADLEARIADLGQFRAVAQELGVQLERMNVEVNAPPRVSAIERAEPPTDRDLKYKVIAVIFAGFVAFGLVALGVSRLEFEHRRMSRAAEVTHELGLRHLGDVPSISGIRWGRLLTFKGQSADALHDQMTESIDSIRATLVHQAGKIEGTPVVMITSATEHEGKSTVASRLAVSLANSGRRTLLIDGHLRDPQVHRTFNLPQEPGLCDLLRDGGQMPEAVVRDSEIPGLSVLTSGACDERSLQTLARGGLHPILEHLRERFQFIVVDGAPILTVSDSLAFGEQANLALLSVRRDVSRIPKVYEACERLKGVGVEVMGVVVNGEG